MVNRRESHTHIQVKRRWDPGRHGGDKKVGGRGRGRELQAQKSAQQNHTQHSGAPFLPWSRP